MAPDTSTPPAHPALTAFASTSSCSTLRASSEGFHTLCYSRGEPTTDFAGAPLTIGAVGVRTLLFAARDGRTTWGKPTCQFVNNWADIDGLPTGDAVLAGTIDKPCTIGTTTVSSAGKFDGVVARFDATGALQWMHRFGGANNDHALQVRFDALGNAIVTGSVNGVPDSTSLPIAASGGSYVAKLSPTGDVVWTKSFTKSYGQRVGVGPDNAVYMLATLSDVEDYGAGPIARAAGENVAAVVKYAADGSFVWQQVIRMRRTAGATEGTIPTSIAVDGDSVGGAWFVIGYAGYDVEFGAVKLTSPGKENTIAIGHVDDKGGALGGQVFEEDFSTISGHLATGSSGKAFFVTSYQGLPSAAFLASLGADGKAAWSARIGESTTGNGVAFDGASIMLLGGFRKELVLAGKTLTPVGTDDSFVARFEP